MTMRVCHVHHKLRNIRLLPFYVGVLEDKGFADVAPKRIR